MLNVRLCAQHLQCVNKALFKKYSVIVNRENVILLYDNARLHTARMTEKKIGNSVGLFDSYLPYSPDFAQTDYYLSNHCKMHKFKSLVKIFPHQNLWNFYSKSFKELPYSKKSHAQLWKKHWIVCAMATAKKKRQNCKSGFPTCYSQVSIGNVSIWTFVLCHQ